MKHYLQSSFILIWISLFTLSCQGNVKTATIAPVVKKENLPENYTCKKGLLKDKELSQEAQVRFALWRAQAMPKASKNQYRILITGDSIAALFVPDLIQKNLPNEDILNQGIPGDTTLLLSERFDRDVLVYRPSVIFISIGGNDIIGGRCVDEAIMYTDKLIRHIQSINPKIKIVFVSVPPTNVKRLNEITPYYNQELQSIIAKYKSVYYLNLWNELAEKDNPVLKSKYVRKFSDGRSDSIHFNDDGYSIWAELAKPYLKK